MSTFKDKVIYYFQNSYESKDVFLLAFIVLYINAGINAFFSLKGLPYPYNSFLITPDDRFGDFFKVIDGFQIADTWEGVNATFIYYENVLPFAATLYFVFANLILFIGNKYVVSIFLCLITFGCIYLIARKKGNDRATVFFTLVSYPMLFTLDRGNIAILVFLLLLFALTTEKVMLSTLALALAASIKLTPVIFMFPILLNRPLSVKWLTQVLLLFLAWFLLINFISIQINGHLLTPSIFDPFVLFTETISSYTKHHIDSMKGLAYGSSLYMVIAYISHKLQILPLFKPHGLAIITWAVIVFFLLLKKDIINTLEDAMTRNKMIFILCISFVLFMPVTGDYYLLIMFIPLLAYPKTYYSFGYFLAYGLLLGAKNFPYIDFINNNNISVQVLINPLLLLLLLLAEFNMINFMKRDSQTLNTDKSVDPKVVENTI